MTFDLNQLIDERNEPMWQALNEAYTIDLQPSDEPNYRCYSAGILSTIYIVPGNLNKESFTHEMLHIYLRLKDVYIGRAFANTLAGSNTLSRIFSSKLLEHIGNCLDHIKMFPMYEQLGFDTEKFITDHRIFKLKSEDLAYLKKYYRRQGTHNIQAVDLYIGKFIAIFADFNTDFDYEPQLAVLRQIDSVLYDLLDKFIISWEDFDIDKQDVIYNNYYDMLGNLYQDLKKWMSGKTFA